MKIPNKVAVLVNACKKNVIKKPKWKLDCFLSPQTRIRLYKWRVGLPMTEDSAATIPYIINCSIVICFSKKAANVATSTTVTKRKRSQMGHTI